MGFTLRAFFVLAAALVLAGLWAATELPLVFEALRFSFHQDPDRTWQCSGKSLALCARCIGMWTGEGLAMLPAPLNRDSRWYPALRALLLAALLGNLAEWLAEGSSLIARCFLGVALGSSAAAWTLALPARPRQREAALPPLLP